MVLRARSGNELLCFAASPPLALALGETFPRFRILALLLLLGRARVVVSHTLLLRPLRGGTPLVVFRPVSAKAPVTSRHRGCGERTGDDDISITDGWLWLFRQLFFQLLAPAPALFKIAHDLLCCVGHLSKSSDYTGRGCCAARRKRQSA
jgi:hypothetical protein